jgi:N-acetylmuramoyl-L-alanine amidase
VRKIDTIAIHQSGTSGGTVESIRRYHQQALGWSDIGYHYVIYRDGTVHAGRPLDRPGAHVRGANAQSIGICCLGAGDAFPVNRGYMTPPMWRSLAALVRDLQPRFEVPVANIRGHREFPSGRAQHKTCPGWDVAFLRRLLSSLPDPQPPTPS